MLHSRGFPGCYSNKRHTHTLYPRVISSSSIHNYWDYSNSTDDSYGKYYTYTILYYSTVSEIPTWGQCPSESRHHEVFGTRGSAERNVSSHRKEPRMILKCVWNHDDTRVCTASSVPLLSTRNSFSSSNVCLCFKGRLTCNIAVFTSSAQFIGQKLWLTSLNDQKYNII